MKALEMSIHSNGMLVSFLKELNFLCARENVAVRTLIILFICRTYLSRGSPQTSLEIL